MTNIKSKNRKATAFPTPKRDFLFCCVSLLLCARHIFQLLGFASIASVLFKLLYVLTFLYLAEAFLKRIKKSKSAGRTLLICVGIALLVYVVFTLFSQYSSDLESSICFLLVFPLFLFFDTATVSLKDAKFYFHWLITIGVTLVLMMFVPGSYKGGELLLYTLNGNQSGLLYMSIFVGIYAYQFTAGKNLLVWGVLVGLLVGCYLTGSRTSFFCCVICVLLSLALNTKNGKGKRVVYAAFFFYVLFPILVNLVSKSSGTGIMNQYQSFFTGRDRLWVRIFDSLQKDPFLFRVDEVLYDHYGIDLGAHNVWLDIAWKYSLPVALSFLSAIYLTCNTIASKLKYKKSAVVVAVFVVGLIHMTFEASLISGALDYSLYYLFAILCAISLIENTEAAYESKVVDQCNHSGL